MSEQVAENVSTTDAADIDSFVDGGGDSQMADTPSETADVDEAADTIVPDGDEGPPEDDTTVVADDTGDDEEDIADDEDDAAETSDTRPGTEEEMNREFAALTARRRKVSLRREEREELVGLRAQSKDRGEYTSKLESYATGLEKQSREATEKLQLAQSSPLEALRAAGYTVDDVVALVANPDAKTPRMVELAEARRQAGVEQQQTAQQALQQENLGLRRQQAARDVGDRVVDAFQQNVEKYPAILQYSQGRPGEVLQGVRDYIVAHAEKTGNILDPETLFSQAEPRLRAQLEGFGVSFSNNPQQTRGVKTSEQPRTRPSARPNRGRVAKPVVVQPPEPEPEFGAGALDDLDSFAESWNG